MQSERQLMPVLDFCVVDILFISFTFEFSSHVFGVFHHRLCTFSVRNDRNENMHL